jgi:hypothetical protein
MPPCRFSLYYAIVYCFHAAASFSRNIAPRVRHAARSVRASGIARGEQRACFLFFIAAAVFFHFDIFIYFHYAFFISLPPLPPPLFTFSPLFDFPMLASLRAVLISLMFRR